MKFFFIPDIELATDMNSITERDASTQSTNPPTTQFSTTTSAKVPSKPDANCVAENPVYLSAEKNSQPWPGTKSSLSIAGKIVRKNASHRMPDRLKIVFSNHVVDDEFNFSYLHECSKVEHNIFNDNTFKIELQSVPEAFDKVTYSKYSFPSPGTSLKDNFILQGSIFGVYDNTLNCKDLEAKSGPNVQSNFVRIMGENIPHGPNNEFALADRHVIFYRRGSVDNIMAKDEKGTQPYLELLRRYANDTGCDGCYGWKWFGCLADWTEKIPEGFSCGRAVSSVKKGCKEIYEPVDCSDLVVKVASEGCTRKYKKQLCPDAALSNETLKTDYCHREINERFEETDNWVINSRNLGNLSCCCDSEDCCNDCFAPAYLGT